jgi:NitT/TauT family transport system permease protein
MGKEPERMSVALDARPVPVPGQRVRLAPAWRWSRGSAAIRKLRILVVLLAAWEVGVRALSANPLLFPPASAVLHAWVVGLFSGEILGYAAQSLLMLVLAMLIAATITLVVVTAATFTQTGHDLLETLTSIFNPLPAVALLPLAVLWFGLGTNSLIFVLVNSVLWPLALNAVTGFATVPPTLLRVGQNLGLSGLGLVRGILLPAAFPYLLTGLKIGWAFAWRTVIAAELVFGVAGDRGGLGWYIYRNRYELNTADVFAGLLTIIAIGLLVESLVFQTIERRTVVRWGMQARLGAVEAP